MSKFAFIFVLCLVCVNADIEAKTKNDFAENIFSKLLNSIANANEQRFDTMKKLVNMQDQPVDLDALRTSDQDGSTEEMDPIVAFIVNDDEDKSSESPDTPATTCDYSDSSDANSSSEKNQQIDKEELTLRAWKACQKNAVKMCQKACVHAHKKTCTTYSCSRSMKKEFKKQCKKACKARFV